MKRTILQAAAAVATLLPLASAHPAEGYYLHKARQGDTLISLSERYLAQPQRWDRLQKLNRIGDPRRIPTGSLVKIPLSMMRQMPARARVSQAHGDVASGETKLVAGALLDEGSEVRTGKDSSVTLQMADGSLLTLQGESRIQLERLKTYAGTDMHDTGAKVMHGRVETRAAKQNGAGARFEVRTPLALTAVRGTHFRVSADAQQQVARSEVLEGRVAVSGEAVRTNKAVELAGGSGTVVEAGKGPLPPVPLLGAPEAAGLPELQERILMRFKLPAMVQAAAYRGQIAPDSSFQTVLADAVFDKPELKFAGLPDGDYVLRVRAIDRLGLEGKDADHAFRLKARPEPPFLSAPRNKGKVVGETVAFQWAKADEAARYHLQLAADPGFTKPLVDRQDLTGTDYTPPGKSAPGEYYWRMASLRADGDRGPYSDVQSFVLKPLPPTPNPPAVDDKGVVFSWPAEPGQAFLFQMARDEKFQDIVHEARLTEPQLTLPRPEGGTYFMRVQATDPDGFVGPFTATQRFEVPRPFPWWMLLLLIPAL